MTRTAERRLWELTPALLRPGGLQDSAAAALERTLADDPDNADALWKLAEVHRRQGDFDAARGLHRRLRTRGPDRHKAAWLHQALSGDGSRKAAPGGLWPAPFVWMKNFLAPGECDRLLALGVARRECFKPAMTGDPSAPRVDPEVRMTSEADRRTMKEVRPRIGPKIRSVLPDVLARLGMAGLDRYGIEMGMGVYPGGGFYRAHTDSQSEENRSRALSFVLPDRSTAQQHRLLSQRLLAPGVSRAVRDGRLRGWTLGPERPRVAARGRGRGVNSRCSADRERTRGRQGRALGRAAGGVQAPPLHFLIWRTCLGYAFVNAGISRLCRLRRIRERRTDYACPKILPRPAK